MKEKTKKRKAARIILIIVGVILAVALIAGLLFCNNVGKQVAEGLLYQNKELDTKQNSIKQLEMWGYDKEGFLSKVTEEPITFNAEDGNIVPAVIWKDKTTGSESKTAILVHGAGGDHVCMYPVAEVYLENGYQVIAIDQRACGDSTDDKVSFGYFESLDVKAAVDYAKQELKADKVIVHGQSMGGLTTAVYAATEHAKKNVDAFILDSCIDSMDYMFRGVWGQLGGKDDGSVDFAITCGDWYLKQHYGFGFDDVDAKQTLKKDMVPTLMLYATEDELIPKDRADMMLDAIGASKKEIYSFSCGHIESILKYKQECSDAIMKFVED